MIPERDAAPPGGGGAESAERLGEGRDVQPHGSGFLEAAVHQAADMPSAMALAKWNRRQLEHLADELHVVTVGQSVRELIDEWLDGGA